MHHKPAAATASQAELNSGSVSPGVAATVGFIRDGDHRVTDPGMVRHRSVVLDPLDAVGVAAEQVTDVVLSHHHSERRLNVALPPDARVLDHWAIHRGDQWTWRDAEGFQLTSSIKLIRTSSPRHRLHEQSESASRVVMLVRRGPVDAGGNITGHQQPAEGGTARPEPNLLKATSSQCRPQHEASRPCASSPRRGSAGVAGGQERGHVTAPPSLSRNAVTGLTDVLADILATPGIDPDHAYEVGYCRDQVRRHLPVIEGLVIAGVLHEAPERLALDQEAQAACRWWVSALIRAITCRSPTPVTVDREVAACPSRAMPESRRPSGQA
jgi:hypothetical protein